jgi:hypothetical protein
VWKLLVVLLGTGQSLLALQLMAALQQLQRGQHLGPTV